LLAEQGNHTASDRHRQASNNEPEMRMENHCPATLALYGLDKLAWSGADPALPSISILNTTKRECVETSVSITKNSPEYIPHHAQAYMSIKDD